MADPRFAGVYVPGQVQIIVGAPAAAGGLAIAIPGLPAAAGFPLLISGRAADTFATGAQTTDGYTLQVGADGEVVAVLSYDRTGTIAITVMRSSIANLAFSAAYRALTNPAAPLFATFPVSVKDPNAPGALISGVNCVIQRSADIEYSQTEGTNTWTFLAANYTGNHGARIF